MHSNSGKRQATLVALYGAKPAAFQSVIGACQEKIKEVIGSDFSPYEMDQIHATIVGLEHTVESALYNHNFYRYRQKALPMDIAGFRKYLLSSEQFPFCVQIGGFADRDYPFRSRGLRPYSRSFAIQGDKAVVMGWPIRGKPLQEAPKTASMAIQEARLYPCTLDRIRISAQKYNILHGYHRDLSDVDNDFYFRIGVIKPPDLSELTRQRIENSACQALARSEPMLLEIRVPDLYFAIYEAESLPLESTRVWAVKDNKLTDRLLRTLYT